MNLYVPTAKYGGWIIAIRCVELVIVDQAKVVTPDSDSEFISTLAAGLSTINAGQHKSIGTAAIDPADAFKLRLVGPGDHHPVVARALEVQTGGLKLEFGGTDRHARARLVF